MSTGDTNWTITPYRDCRFSPCPLFEDEKIVEQPVQLTSLTKRLTARAEEFIVHSAAEEKQFFLYYSFHHVHFPQFSGLQFRNRWDSTATGCPHNPLPSSLAGSFGDAVAELDWAVGRMLDTLHRVCNVGFLYRLSLDCRRGYTMTPWWCSPRITGPGLWTRDGVRAATPDYSGEQE